ncbi:methyltransferase domain-containing protein [Rhodobacterales bacterium]|nr:methyltransferase domain-containing protein [Rhodobacterales bacterium]
MKDLRAGRAIVPEMLDLLPPEDAAAQGSRRDLRRINALMFQTSVMSGLLRRYVANPPRRIAEIGCGDGHATLALARKMAPAWPDVTLTLVDQQDLVRKDVREQIAAFGWSLETVTADVFDWLGRGERQDLMLTNLFLHHFHQEQLTDLLTGIADLADCFVATEPRRSRFALMASGTLGVIGANAVTRHDAPASVWAGFTGHELSELWPGGSGNVLCERSIGPFTHGFAARGGEMP